MTSTPRLPRSFFDRPTLQVARELLGTRLVRLVSGEISWMGYSGEVTPEDLHTKVQLMRMINVRPIESHPHDAMITKKAPDYQLSGE